MGSKHTKTVVKRTRLNLFPLRRLKRFGMGPQILKRFYSCTIESILTGCITASYGNCSAFDLKALQRVVRTAQYVTGAKLPGIQDLYNMRCQRIAHKIVREGDLGLVSEKQYIYPSRLTNFFFVQFELSNRCSDIQKLFVVIRDGSSNTMYKISYKQCKKTHKITQLVRRP